MTSNILGHSGPENPTDTESWHDEYNAYVADIIDSQSHGPSHRYDERGYLKKLDLVKWHQGKRKGGYKR